MYSGDGLPVDPAQLPALEKLLPLTPAPCRWTRASCSRVRSRPLRRS